MLNRQSETKIIIGPPKGAMRSTVTFSPGIQPIFNNASEIPSSEKEERIAVSPNFISESFFNSAMDFVLRTPHFFYFRFVKIRTIIATVFSPENRASGKQSDAKYQQ